MENIILGFVETLRKGGMKIAVSEIIDALTGLSALGIDEEKKVYQILRATLLKNESDKDIFDLTYRLFFHQAPKIENKGKNQPCHRGDIPTKGTAGMSTKAKSFYGAIYNNDAAAYIKEIQKALEDPLDTTCTAQELLQQLKVTLSWFMVKNALEQTDNDEGLETLANLEIYLRHSVEKTLTDAEETNLANLVANENLLAKDLGALTENQVAAMEERIGKLGKKLAAKYSYRLKPSKTGVIDMRKVLRETAKGGYIPANMEYLNKEKNRPSIIVLCDISGSMAKYSSFFLQLVYAMERKFKEIHSYLFVDNIVEAHFPRKSITVQEAIAAAIGEAYVARTGRTGQHCTTTGISDYGKMFHHFLQKFGEVLDEKTTIFIMGDAKTNWFPPNKEDLKTIAEKSKALYWLNPDPKESWNKEDSVMGLYAPFCKEVLECRTLLQLEKLGSLLKK